MICVRKQLEIEAFLRAELFVGIHVVGTDSENNGIALGKFGLVHLKLVGFARSTWGLVFWIEVKDDPLASVIL